MPGCTRLTIWEQGACRPTYNQAASVRPRHRSTRGPGKRAHQTTVAESQLESAGAKRRGIRVCADLQIQLPEVGVVAEWRAGGSLVLPGTAGVHAFDEQ